MAFSDFTLAEVKSKLGLRLVAGTLFADIGPYPLAEWLTTELEENVQLASVMGTEKGRSELLVAPLLVQAYKRAPQKPTLFSGVEFNVDPGRGLKGFCDYLFSLSPDQFVPEAPVIMLVEAKNDNYSGALPQCIAEMYAAQEYNRISGKAVGAIYGAITTGLDWNFLRLIGDEILYDAKRYHPENAPTIVAILLEMLKVSVVPMPAPLVAETA